MPISFLLETWVLPLIITLCGLVFTFYRAMRNPGLGGAIEFYVWISITMTVSLIAWLVWAVLT
jgi:hypothetical protein